MSRVLKFRAWNKAARKFTYFGSGEPDIDYTACHRIGMFLEATNSVYFSAYEDPEQYTGSKVL